jgi:D-alanine-D-alanine ligase-like ATP-grasp enzyme
MIHYNGTFTNKMIRAAAQRLGFGVVDHPTDKASGYILFPDGRKNFFYKNHFGVTLDGISATVDQKYIAEHWLGIFGHNTITGEAFGLHNFENKDEFMATIRAYVDQNLTYPIIVKPCNASQGNGVTKVHGDEDLAAAVENVLQFDEACMAQEFVTGKDFRLLVFNGRMYFAYQRVPLSVVGDGGQTIQQLLHEKIELVRKQSGKKKLKIDERNIEKKLSKEGLSFSSVLDVGTRVLLLDNANLSTGGDIVDVTDSLHKSYKDIAINIAKDFNIGLCGVDFFIQGEPSEFSEDYKIIEVNAHPGVGEFARRSGIDITKVEDLYVDVLQYLSEK